MRVLMGRIEVVLGPSATWESVRDRLALVFGIGNFSRAGRARLDVDAIAAEILKDLGPDDPATFRVSARRADKRFPLPSPQIEREVGGRIKEARGWVVDLDRPAFTIHVEALTSDERPKPSKSKSKTKPTPKPSKTKPKPKPTPKPSKPATSGKKKKPARAGKR